MTSSTTTLTSTNCPDSTTPLHSSLTQNTPNCSPESGGAELQCIKCLFTRSSNTVLPFLEFLDLDTTEGKGTPDSLQSFKTQPDVK